MTFYLPRRFVVAAVSAAVLLFVAGLVLLSGSDGDGPVAALAAGTVPTLVPLPSTTADAPAPAATHSWWSSSATTAVPTTVAAPPPVADTVAPATTAEPPAATARRSPSTSAATTPPTAPPATAAPTTAPPLLPTTTVLPFIGGSEGSVASAVVAAHNRERAARGLAPLQRSSCLDSIALAWASQLATTERLVHNPSSAAATEGCMLWHAVGENIGFDGTVDALEQAWMASSIHEANILDPDFTQVGVGAVRGDDGLYYVVVNFAG